MNPLIKSLSVLALGGLFAGTAVAGPGDAHASFGTQATQKTGEVQVAVFRTPAKSNTVTETKIVPSANSKTGALTTIQVTSRPASK